MIKISRQVYKLRGRMESFSLPPYICVSLISGKNRLGGSGIHVSPPQDRHICETAVAMVWSVRNCSGYGLVCEKLQWLWFGVWETAQQAGCVQYKLCSLQAVFSTACEPAFMCCLDDTVRILWIRDQPYKNHNILLALWTVYTLKEMCNPS